jgi:uncharacterized NAD(P)/FAD-binding protein YdhS
MDIRPKPDSERRNPSRVAPLQITICGGGASAVLLIDALRRQTKRGIAISILEPRPHLGGGAAYSTDSPLHLLNVPAGNMGGQQNTGAFLQWLRTHRPRAIWNWTANDFAPRALYGEYLRSLIQEAQASPNLQLSWLRTMADSVTPARNGWEVVPAHGAPLKADIVVLAMGNETPSPVGEHLMPQERCLVINDPWDVEAKASIPKDAPVLLMGTGLTAVDVAVELLAKRGHTGPIIAFSRRGLLPRPQGPATAVPPHVARYIQSASVSQLIQLIRQFAEQDSSGARLRGLIRELRRHVPPIWSRLTMRERRQFLRHLRPFWDVYRHRIAPSVHRRITAALANGQLTIVRGRLDTIECLRAEGKLRVTLRQPSGGKRVLEVARLVNCTGPCADPSKSSNPLLQSLVGDGTARADSLGLGLATDDQSRVRSADGTVHSGMYALGALARGQRFETTAIPEITDQADAVARDILAQCEEAYDDGVRPSLSAALPPPVALASYSAR